MIFFPRKFIKPLKIPLLSLRHSGRIISVRSKLVSLRHILILSKHIYIYIYIYICIYFLPSIRLKFFASNTSTSCLLQDAPKSILDAINNIQFPYFSDVTSCYWLIGYRCFGINLHTHLHGGKYSLIFEPLNMRPLDCLETSSPDFQVTRTPKPQ